MQNHITDKKKMLINQLNFFTKFDSHLTQFNFLERFVKKQRAQLVAFRLNASMLSSSCYSGETWTREGHLYVALEFIC